MWKIPMFLRLFIKDLAFQLLQNEYGIYNNVYQNMKLKLSKI